MPAVAIGEEVAQRAVIWRERALVEVDQQRDRLAWQVPDMACHEIHRMAGRIARAVRGL